MRIILLIIFYQPEYSFFLLVSQPLAMKLQGKIINNGNEN